jgi:hypothetical protein
LNNKIRKKTGFLGEHEKGCLGLLGEVFLSSKRPIGKILLPFKNKFEFFYKFLKNLIICFQICK